DIRISSQISESRIESLHRVAMITGQHQSATVQIQELGIFRIDYLCNVFFCELERQVLVKPFLRITVHSGPLALEIGASGIGGRRARLCTRSRLCRVESSLIKHAAIKTSRHQANDE